jgi:aminopeptidase-like protein
MTNYYRMNTGDSLTADALTSISNGSFDVVRDARWHRIQMNFTGDWEMSGFSPEWEKSGRE